MFWCQFRVQSLIKHVAEDKESVFLPGNWEKSCQVDLQTAVFKSASNYFSVDQLIDAAQ